MPQRSGMLACACLLFAACSPDEPTSPASAPPDAARAPGAALADAPVPARAGTSRDDIARALGLPPRRAIAGLAGFQSSSRVVFAAEPERVHTLAATFLFPERARLALTLEEDGLVHRLLLYRAGARGFALEDRAATSRELAAGEFAELALQTELRRALFLWPDGFTWSGEGETRATDLGAHGRLEAALGGDGLPIAMRSFDGNGRAAETLDEIAWQPRGARRFPARFALSAGGARIWSEDVVTVETALDYVDPFFLPPDRRGASAPAAPESSGTEVAAIDWPAAWELVLGLEGAAPRLEGAVDFARSSRATWDSRGTATLDAPLVELDRAARPLAVVLEAPAGATPPADGWSRRAEQPAWSSALAADAPPTAERIAAAIAAAGLDGEAVRIFVRLRAQGAELVLLPR